MICCRTLVQPLVCFWIWHECTRSKITSGMCSSIGKVWTLGCRAPACIDNVKAVHRQPMHHIFRSRKVRNWRRPTDPSWKAPWQGFPEAEDSWSMLRQKQPHQLSQKTWGKKDMSNFTARKVPEIDRGSREATLIEFTGAVCHSLYNWTSMSALFLFTFGCRIATLKLCGTHHNNS